MNDRNRNQQLFSTWHSNTSHNVEVETEPAPLSPPVPPANQPVSEADSIRVASKQKTVSVPTTTADEHPDDESSPNEKKLPGKRNREGYSQYTAYLRTTTRKNVQIALLTRPNEKRDFSELVEQLLSDWLKNTSNNPGT